MQKRTDSDLSLGYEKECTNSPLPVKIDQATASCS